MPFLRRKVKATKEEFAEVLFYSIVLSSGEERVQTTAELFQFDIGSKNNLDKLATELLDLDMWLVVYTCERLITDIDKRNACLDIFHRLVYQRLLEDQGLDFKEWLIRQTAIYAYYNKASKADHELGPLWELANAFNIKLHGELNLDSVVQAGIADYIGTSIQAFEGLVKKYKISGG